MDQFASDSTAALQLALMWYITANEDYATKATQILDAWGKTLKVVNGTTPIKACLILQKVRE
jgi:hypothetical protein